MIEWVSTLKLAHTNLEMLKPPDPLNNAALSPSQGVDVGAKLLIDLHQIVHQNLATKILFNFQIAAIHLHFIFRGTKAKTPLVGVPMY